MFHTRPIPRRHPLHPAMLMLMGRAVAAHRHAEKLRRQVALGFNPVNRDGLPIRAGDDVGLAAGMSQDGVTSVHDRAMPRWYEDGQASRFDLQESRDYHERVEKALLDAGHSYNMSRAQAAQFMTEELLHAVDHLGGRRTLSGGSSRLDPRTGDIAREAQARFAAGGAYHYELIYPLAESGMSEGRKRAELFARLGTLYFADPDTMKRLLPLAHGAFDEQFRLTRSAEEPTEFVQGKVWTGTRGLFQDDGSLPPGRPVSGGPAAGPGAGSADQLGQVPEGTVRDFRLGDLRQSIARSFGAPLGGRVVRLNDLESNTAPLQAGRIVSGGGKNGDGLSDDPHEGPEGSVKGRGVRFSSAGEAGPSSIVSPEDLEAVVRVITKNANHPKIVLHDAPASLPDEIKHAAQEQGADIQQVPGVTHKGIVHLIRSNIPSTAKAEEVLLHERWHQARASVFRKSVTAKLAQLYHAIGGVEGVRRYARKYGVSNSMEGYIEGLNEAGARLPHKYTQEVRAAILSDELLAHIAQKGPPGLMQRAREILGAVRAWLRDNGFARLARYDDSDLAHLLRLGRRAMLDIETGGDEPRFLHAVKDAWLPYTEGAVWNRATGQQSAKPRQSVNRDGLPIRSGDDVGLAAGMSQDGVTSVHDRAMPRWYEDGRGNRFDLRESRDYHERVEKSLLDAGHSYNEAHRVATETEHARMRQMGFDPNAVEDFQKPYIDQAAHRARALGNTTPDVTGEPYQDSGENAMREDGGELDPRYILDRDGRRYTQPLYGRLLDSIEAIVARDGNGDYAVIDPNSGRVLTQGGNREQAQVRAQRMAERLGRRRLQAQLDAEPARSQQQLRERFEAGRSTPEATDAADIQPHEVPPETADVNAVRERNRFIAGRGTARYSDGIIPSDERAGARDIEYIPMFSRAIREEGYPADAGNPVSSFRNLEDLKAHPDYAAAKMGDPAAAFRLVWDLVKPEQLAEARRRFGDGAIYVPAVAKEASGYNRIPDALAELYANATKGRVEHEIVQANKAYHTGADPMERVISRPLFTGPVIPGARYVLVDDVTTMGATLAEMADHVRAGGGRVVGSVLLANASRSGTLKPSPSHTRLVEERLGDEIRRQIHIEPKALTYDEARYLAGFGDADGFRNRVAKAKVERSRRILSKGIGQEPKAP